MPFLPTERWQRITDTILQILSQVGRYHDAGPPAMNVGSVTSWSTRSNSSPELFRSVSGPTQEDREEMPLPHSDSTTPEEGFAVVGIQWTAVQGVSLQDWQQVILTTDASIFGWRAQLNGRVIQGHYSSQMSQSISLLELRSICLALFSSHFCHCHVLVRTDSVHKKNSKNKPKTKPLTT